MNPRRLFAAAGWCAILTTPAFPQAANLTNADRQFMAAAAEMNMAEAHMGKMAQERASRQEVKDYGARIERDHTDSYGKLSGLANQLQVNIPSGLGSKHQATVSRLSGLSGQQFDQQFLQEQIRAHEEGINRFQRASTQAGNPQLKDYANAQLPILREHLRMAQELSTGGAGSASRMEEGAAAGGAAAGGRSAVHYGTVTKYEAGKTLEVKMRGRTGRHSYDLTNMSANITGTIAPNSRVKITESVDENGRRSITVEPAPSGGAAARQKKGKTEPPPQQ